MYGREYDGKKLNFEPSGGLLHAALVMQDKETDSYWSIMTGDSLAGEFRGTRLEELPLGVKAQWKDWVAEHPDTLVLSVDGAEHIQNSPYDNYYDSKKAFRGAKARDRRLPTKESIFAFQIDDQAYAVPFSAFEGGAAFELGDRAIFLHRPAGVAIFHSTTAFVSSGEGFEERDGAWHDIRSGAVFDPDEAEFRGGDGGAVGRLEGFDTFWFSWSMTHPETRILGD